MTRRKVGGAIAVAFALMIMVNLEFASPSSSSHSHTAMADPTATTTPAAAGGYQPNTSFSCDQVAPASKSFCESHPPNPNDQGGVPAIQPPTGAPTNLTTVAITEGDVRAYVTAHYPMDVAGTAPTITSVDLLPASTASALVGGLQGPANAPVYVVRIKGPLTMYTANGPIAGPYEELVFSAATGNILALHIPPG